MVNVEQITSTLAKLPDQALQRYAMMHKDDPYIMSLAVSESKRRKEMRSAGQGQMQPQPKVVDQMVAEMAPQPMPAMPEEQGIGALPAAAQMNFADGGITGYAGGGEVERYSGQYGSLTGGDVFAQLDKQKADRLNQLNSQLAVIEPQLRAAASSGDQMSIQTYAQQAQAIRDQINAVREESGNRAKTVEGLAAASSVPSAASAAPTAAQSAPVYDLPKGARGELNAAENRIIQSQVPPPPPPPAPRAKIPSAASVPAPKAEGLEDMQKRLMADVNKDQEGLAGKRQGIVDETKALRDKKLSDYEAELEKRGDVFKGREERIGKQEKNLEGMGDKYLGLALLQAGAAMMTTPGGIGAALGKGVQVGSERYAMGMEKINAAQEKFAEARDKLDELRINREDLTSAERRKLKGEADGAELEGKKFIYDGAVSDLGIKRKDVDSLFGALAREQQSKAEIASRDRATAQSAANAKAQLEATLSDPQRLAFQGYLAKTVTPENPKGDPAKAYETWKAATAANQRVDLSALANLKKDYKEMADFGATPAERAEGKRMLDLVNAQISSLSGMGGGAGGFGAPPPDAVRLKKPGG
jgi:hypothetical protein